MNEWAKASISTFLGFLAGLLAEPLKAYFERVRRCKLVRGLLYRDLANVEYAMTTLSSYQDFPAYVAASQSDLQFSDLRSDIFEWAYGTQKEAFYRLPEFQAIIFIYQIIRRLGSLDPKDCNSFSAARAQLGAALNSLHELLAENGLDQKAFKKAQRDLASLIKKLGKTS
jgi:hypothetical protein